MENAVNIATLYDISRKRADRRRKSVKNQGTYGLIVPCSRIKRYGCVNVTQSYRFDEGSAAAGRASSSCRAGRTRRSVRPRRAGRTRRSVRSRRTGRTRRSVRSRPLPAAPADLADPGGPGNILSASTLCDARPPFCPLPFFAESGRPPAYKSDNFPNAYPAPFLPSDQTGNGGSADMYGFLFQALHLPVLLTNICNKRPHGMDIRTFFSDAATPKSDTGIRPAAEPQTNVTVNAVDWRRSLCFTLTYKIDTR